MIAAPVFSGTSGAGTGAGAAPWLRGGGQREPWIRPPPFSGFGTGPRRLDPSKPGCMFLQTLLLRTEDRGRDLFSELSQNFRAAVMRL
jgi:hypothetical protein